MFFVGKLELSMGSHVGVLTWLFLLSVRRCGRPVGWGCSVWRAGGRAGTVGGPPAGSCRATWSDSRQVSKALRRVWLGGGLSTGDPAEDWAAASWTWAKDRNVVQ